MTSGGVSGATGHELGEDGCPKSYLLRDGLRFVFPYYYRFSANAKERWRDKLLLDVFSIEFPAHTREFYSTAIESGRIRVNGACVGIDYVIKNGDCLTHLIHRHEPPVLDHPICILENTTDFVVVDKPPSIPVHPCGRYRKNTVDHILRAEQNLHPLFIVHRLDRLTSGLLLFCKSSQLAREVSGDISSGSVTKEYVARVRGTFPDPDDGCEEVVVCQPVRRRDPRQGIWECGDGDSSKPAETHFRRLFHDPTSDTSVVLCRPVTGRTHQIRLHLQWLGHPIANDPCYGIHPPTWKSKRSGEDGEDGSGDDGKRRRRSLSDWVAGDRTRTADEGDPYIDPICPQCRLIYRDPHPRLMEIWLHALRYRWREQVFETPLPQWAQETFVVPPLDEDLGPNDYYDFGET